MEIVKLGQKTIVGLSARTSNNDYNMSAVIENLWERLFDEGVFAAIKNKSNSHTIGLYSGYENGVKGTYEVTAGCEVDEAKNNPAKTVVKIIPAGNYAKFTTDKNDIKEVNMLWQEIWKTPLEGTFTGDFEEYCTEPDGTQGKINIYIAVK